MVEQRTGDSFDRLIGMIDGLPSVTKSRPTTVTSVMPFIGNSQTHVVQTYKGEDGFTVFLQMVDADGRARIVIPPKVANAIYRQRDSLVKQARKRAGKDRWDRMDPDQQEAHIERLRTSRRPKSA